MLLNKPKIEIFGFGLLKHFMNRFGGLIYFLLNIGKHGLKIKTGFQNIEVLF